MPQVYICTRCAEKIDPETQDWVVVSIDTFTSGSSGLETRAHADCEVERLKVLRKNSLQPLAAGPRPGA